MSVDLLAWLKYATFVSSAAIVLVLLLRKPLRHLAGVGAAYALWWLVPLAILGSLLPARKLVPQVYAPFETIGGFVVGSESALLLPQTKDYSAVFIALWLVGMGLMLGALVWQQARFVRGLGQLVRRDDGLWLAESRAGLPALIGLLRPRIVLPVDFSSRYDAEQQQLMLRHETAHKESLDMPGNALVALLRVLFWFNPLLHFAAGRFRHDQELACDARVLQQQPDARRAYAEAMLKTNISCDALPVGCHWGSTHPLKERIMQMQRKLPRQSWRFAGLAAALTLALGSGWAAWAMQPAQSQVASSSQDDYSAQIELSFGGQKAQRFTLSEGYGRPFEVSDEGSAVSFAGQINPVRIGEKLALRMDVHIRRNGQLLAAPMLMLEPGKPGSLRLDGETDTMNLWATITPRDAQAAFEKADTFNPNPAQSDDLMFSVIKRPLPVYPPDAMKAGIEGRVRVLVDVNADGTVKDVKVGSSEPAGVFEEAALSAVREMLFKPQDKETSGFIEIAFVLDK